MHSDYHVRIARQACDPHDPALEMARDGDVAVHYSPFDFVRTGAKVAIVGITPGAQQSRNALASMHAALAGGAGVEEALRMAKDHASFSGAMRSNLVAMLDHVGVARWLGIPSTASLWGEHVHFAHFTSVLRYPVFVGGRYYGGASPDMQSHPLLRRQIDTWFGSELALLPDVLWVPLGDKVAVAVRSVADRKGISPRILDGLPHPSGANAERISYFLGRKAREVLSLKTNPEKIDAGRRRALAAMERLLSV